MFVSIRITCPVHRNILSLMTSSNFPCWPSALTFSLVTLSFHEIRKILRSHLWCAASNFLIVACFIGYDSAPYSNTARISASYSRPWRRCSCLPIFFLSAQMHCWPCPVVSGFLCRCHRHCWWCCPGNITHHIPQILQFLRESLPMTSFNMIFVFDTLMTSPTFFASFSKANVLVWATRPHRWWIAPAALASGWGPYPVQAVSPDEYGAHWTLSTISQRRSTSSFIFIWSFRLAVDNMYDYSPYIGESNGNWWTYHNIDFYD